MADNLHETAFELALVLVPDGSDVFSGVRRMNTKGSGIRSPKRDCYVSDFLLLNFVKF